MKKAVIGVIFLSMLMGCQHDAKHDEHESSIKKQPLHNPDALFRMAKASEQSGDTVTAIRLYHRVLQSDPSHVQTRLTLAHLFLLGSELYEAEVLLKPVSAKTYPEKYRLLGKIYLAKNEPQKALGFFEKILAIQPENIHALEGIAVSYDHMRQHQKAHRFYQKALKSPHMTNTILSNYALSLAMSGQYKKSIGILKDLCQKPTATARDRQNLGTAYALSGDWEHAYQWFSVDLSPQQVDQNMAFLKKRT